MMIDNGAKPSDSLEGETVLHCVVARNSVEKCQYIPDKYPDLDIKWNNCDAFEMSQHYGCKKEIKTMLRAKRDLHLTCDTRSIDNICHNPTKRKTTPLSLAWSYFKTITSSKVRLNRKSTEQKYASNEDCFAVKYCDLFMNEHRSEVQDIQVSVKYILTDISKQFANSADCSHMAYKYILCGSVRDNCKTFGPTEMDAVLELDARRNLQLNNSLGVMHLSSIARVITTPQTQWYQHRNPVNCWLYVVDAAQSFYKEFARKAISYNDKIKHNTRGIVRITFR